MNITIDDTSPQIVYRSKGKSTPGVWQTLHPPDDWTSFCFDNSFHSSSTEVSYREHFPDYQFADIVAVKGDSAAITFNGSAITVYGSKRLAHGPFTAELDGGAPQNLTTKAIFKQEDVQQVIYQADGLDEAKEHTLVLTNRPLYNRPPPKDNELLWFDIDYIVLTSTPSGELYTFTYDDTDPHFTFSDYSWSKYANSTGRHNETSSMSSEMDSWFELEFRGSSVQLFGSINLDHSNFTVTLDGRDLGEFYGGYHMWFATCLFTASGLPEGQHTLRVTDKDSTADKKTFIEVDYAVVNSTIPESQQPVPTSSATSSTSSARAGVDWAQTYSPITTKVVNTAAPLVTASGDTTATSSSNVSLIGIILGVVSALVLLSISVVGVHVYRRKRRLARSNNLAAGLRPGEAWEKPRGYSSRDGRGGQDRGGVVSTATTSFKSWAW